jgi:hypothetical protein
MKSKRRKNGMAGTNRSLAALPIVEKLLTSRTSAIVFKTRLYLLGESERSRTMKELRQKIKTSKTAKRLLHHRRKDGSIPLNPYRKWQGPHWTLVSLAQIEYPPGDRTLHPMRDQMYDWLLAKEHLNFPRSLLIPGQENRFRRCGSQEGNAIWYAIKLGIGNERIHILADRLIKWQWPDGGWNCDKRSGARKSSFMESLVPLRALWLYGHTYGDKKALAAAHRTAELLLTRRLLWRRSDGIALHPSFLKIQYPVPLYDVLFALKVMAEIGRMDDHRCEDALDLLISKRRPDGGFPLEINNGKTSDEITTRGSFADWGPSGKKATNEFVTVDALYVLKEAGLL